MKYEVMTPDNGKPAFSRWNGEKAAYRQPNGKLRWYVFWPDRNTPWKRVAGPENYADQEDSAFPPDPKPYGMPKPKELRPSGGPFAPFGSPQG